MLEKLTENIYLMPHEDNTDRPAIGLICGSEASLVVDAGNSEKHAKDFLREAKKVINSPLKYVVLTHWHWDHVFGAETMGVDIISHVLTNEQLKKIKKLSYEDKFLDERVDNGEEIEFCRDKMKLELSNEERKNIKIKLANIVFKEKLTIDLGGITAVIQNVAGDHAEDSSIIYIPEKKVTFLGDSLCENIYMGEWSYSRKKIFPLIDKIKQFDTDIFVAAHYNVESTDETYQFFNEIKRFGDLVDEEIDEEKVYEKYVINYGCSPDEDEKYYIKTFTNGNKKNNMDEFL